MSSIAEKLQLIAENEQKVFEAGKQAENDAIWDIIQDYGKRVAYGYGFAYTAWDDTTFRPKYDIKPVGRATELFRTSKIIDLEAVLERCGVVLDTSQATDLNNAFNSTTMKVVPPIDLTSLIGSTSGNMVFRQALHTIRKLICDEETPWSTATFQYATGLVNLVIEGVIGQNGFDVHWSTKLSRESIESIMAALSATTSGLSVTLSLTAVNAAFETAEGAGDGSTSEAWAALSATRENWTIALA